VTTDIGNDELLRCAELVGHRFADLALLKLALTHSSFSAEEPGEASNERLEFLGDAVLGWVLADEMYRRHPDFHEGLLTDLRKSVVNAATLAEVARGLGIGPFIRLGRGESRARGGEKVSILANAFEAILGAIYLDAGSSVAKSHILRLLRDVIDGAVPGLATLDPKTQLQELAAARDLPAPQYVVRGEGPDHEKTFHAEVVVGGVTRGAGTGRTKKAAEQEAASRAITSMRNERA
jgi:ribonuclease-3